MMQFNTVYAQIVSLTKFVASVHASITPDDTKRDFQSLSPSQEDTWESHFFQAHAV